MPFTWPTNLPSSPLLQGYSEEPKDTTIRSKMSYGPDKPRNLTTGVIINISLRLLLTQAETVILDTFYFGTIGRVGEIDWIHPRTGLSALLRFTAPPKYTPIGAKFYADLQMEILPSSFSNAYSGAFA